MNIGEDGMVEAFREKSDRDSSRINGGYMVLEPEVFQYIDPEAPFEGPCLQTLIQMGQLDAFNYDGFWQCMDTKREKDYLEKLIAEKKAPWMKWDK